MKRRCQRKKCRHCGKWFQPDHRTMKRQRFCAKPACQKARKLTIVDLKSAHAKCHPREKDGLDV
jgi:hypothetical protein